jgi:type II secretory pathway pseudopilin PulG
MITRRPQSNSGIPSPTHRSPRRLGFTLLEILVATLLGSALLVMLWGAFNMYLRMFETGERVTREAQLLLGMSRQFSESIQGVPALSPPPVSDSDLSFSSLPSPFENDPFGSQAEEDSAFPSLEDDLLFSEQPLGMSSGLGARDAAGTGQTAEMAVSIPTFGLIGSHDQITVHGVLLVPDPNAFAGLNDPNRSAPPLPGMVEDLPPGAHELRTIHFRFLQPDLSPNRTSGETPRRGLLRIDTAWHEADASQWTNEQLEEVFVQAEQEGERGGEGAGGVDLQISRLRRERDGTAQLLPEQLLLFPEVAGIKFRYFDGTFWRDAWDSRLEDRLPLAVEIFLQFRDEKQRRQQLRRRNLERRTASTAEDREMEEAEWEEDWNTLELFDPDGTTTSDFALETESQVFRLLVLCAGAATDARPAASAGPPSDGSREGLPRNNIPPLPSSPSSFPRGVR